MRQLLLFHIDLTLTVAMGTENATKIGLNRKMSFLAKIWRFNRPVNIEHKQIPKRYLTLRAQEVT